MDPRARRALGKSRLVPLAGDDGAFDRELWRSVRPAAPLEQQPSAG